METKTNKKNPRIILGYLMAFAMVFFTTSFAIAQNAVTIIVGGSLYPSEVSWDLTDASGAVIASGAEGTYPATLNVDLDCYDMNMYDSYGDGWDLGSYSIIDDNDGSVYATGTCSGAGQTDNFCPTAPVACNDVAVLYTAGSYAYENSFTITDCDGNILVSGDGTGGYDACEVLPAIYTVNLVDSYGDGWNGGTLTVDGVDYTLDGINDDGFAASFQVGTCPILGCTDATAANYDPLADTDDGSCTYGVPGCVDMTACNYDSSATADDGSCTYAVAPLDCAGNCANGGDALTLNLYDSYGDGWTDFDGSVSNITIDGVDYTIDNAFSASFVLCMDLTVCTDIAFTASNYYDSECSWDITDASGTVIASGANNSGILGTCVGGCTDATAFNYDAAADFDDGSCIAVVSGCMDSTAANYDATANTDDGSCTYGVPGCTDMTACNYDSAATADDGSCTYAVAGYDCSGACLSGEEVTLTLTDSYGDGGGSVTINGNTYTCTGSADVFVFCMDLSVCTDIIYASTDSWPYENGWSLSNANGVLASSDCAGSFGCTPESGIIGNTPGFDCAGNCLTGDLVTVTLYDSYGDGGGEITVDGNVLTNSGSSNSMTICLDLTTCTDVIYASTDSWPYENSWDIVDASGAVIASGADASGNVGACAVYGCIDPAASNYDAAADTDDGSCCYENYITVTCGGGSYQSEVSWTLTNSAGTVVLTGGAGAFLAPFSADVCLPDDCYTVNMADSYGDGWNGNIFEISIGGVSLGNATLTGGSAGTTDFSVGATCPVLGCTDATAVNYDPAANTDDGSCAYSCTAAPQCESFETGVGTWTNNGWINNQGGTTSGSTGPVGAVDGSFYMYYETSTGYAPSVDITSECLDISGLTSPALSFYNHMYGATTGTLDVYVNGNLEWTMSGDQGNQWNWAQVDLSAYAGQSVTIMIEATYGTSYTGDIAIDLVCVDEYVVISGCTDPIATNYDASANTDDGSCTYCAGTMLTLNMYDSYGDGWNGATFTATGNSTGTVFGPYTIASGAAALEMLCMDDDCYTITVGGGSWDAEVSWDVTDASGAVLASGGAPYTNQGALSVNVTCPVYGCTDATALNYDAAATADDGSCAYLCDPYVASASVDNGPSCNGAFDAAATVTVSGSFGNDFWLWDNGSTSSTATGLAAGTYSCTVTDEAFTVDTDTTSATYGDTTYSNCSSTVTVTIDPTPVVSIVGTTFDATPGNANGGVDLAVSGGTPCYNGAALSLAGAPSTTTQWASNAFDVTATSDLQITSIDQPFMSGAGTADVYYRLGSGAGFESDPNGWMLAGSAPVSTSFIGDINNIPVSINMNAGETICIYVQGIGVNTVFGAGVDSTYNSVVSSDANLSIIGGFATGGAPGSGTTYPSAGSYDFGGNLNYSLSSYTYAWSTGATTQNVDGLPLGPVDVTVTDCNGCVATGSWFILTNYVYGCMDTLASNYDGQANTSWDQDTTGLTPACLYDGCTDASATNYDATANNDDGSCTYSCMHPNSGSWDAELTVTFAPDWYSDENSWYIINAITGDTALSSPTYASGGAVDVQTLCAMNGCYYVDGYDSYGDGWMGGTLDIVDDAGNSLLTAFTLGSATTYASSPIFSVGGANCGAGCTDGSVDSLGNYIYANYDANAVIDDGSCSNTIVGCTDPAASNYTPFSNVDDGSCCYDNSVSISVGGGTYLSEVGWTLSLDTVVYATGGAPYASDLCLPDGCYTVDMTDSYGDGWNGSTFDVDGVALGGLTSGSAGSFTFAVGTGDCAVFGCTDAAASNYDPLATDDDGSCCLDNFVPITTGIDYLGTAYEWEFNGMAWSVTLLGDTVPSGVGSNDLGGAFLGGSADLCLPDGCYEFDATDVSGFGVYAWWNINGTQYDPPASGGTYGLPYNMYFEVGSATCPIIGCTDATADNYDSTATYDDGSCTYPCLDDIVTLNLFDSYGDGWNGGFITIDGVDYTMTVGALISFDICLDLAACYDVIYTAGSYTTENSWNITDANGDTIATGGAYPSGNNSGEVGACPIFGCTDSTAVNFDPAADTDDGSCAYDVFGCTDPTATNYDAAATVDDGSCCYSDLVTIVLDDSYGDGWNANSLTVNGVDYSVPDVNGDYTTTNVWTQWMTGAVSFDVCVDLSSCIDVTYNATGAYQTENSWSILDATGNILSSGVGSSTGSSSNVGTCYGCTDPLAANYDPTANTDDGSCITCTDNSITIDVDGGSFQGEVSWTLLASDGSVVASGGAPYNATLCIPDDCYTVDMVDSWGDGWNGNSFIATDDAGAVVGLGTLVSGSNGSFDFSLGVACPVYGCTDPLAVNYDATADTDDGSCDYLGCTNPTANNYDPTATIDDGSCMFDVYGCTDSTANNYDANATIDNGSCTYTILGCTDATACNYDANANTDDGSCTYAAQYYDCAGMCINDSDGDGICDELEIAGCTDATACNYDANATDDNGSCLTAYGCTDPTQFNYDANATCDDGSCVPVTSGCTDSLAINYNAGANTDNGGCLYSGCTDSTANNYDASAVSDDGSCTYTVVSGCTDPAADNYDATATVDDGSCTYPTACSEGPITGLFIDGIIDDRVNANFDNMNTYDANGNQICRVDQIRIQYREVGTSAWSQKNIASPIGYDAVTGICNSTQSTMKPIRNLTLGTTYEWRVKVWYCSGGNGGWTDGPNFTTAGECPNVGNLTATPNNPTKVTFDWDDSNGAYEFARIKVRVDTITNVQLSDWFLVGGFGVMYPTFTKQKNGLTPGETYRGQARTWCDPNGGAYNALSWTPLVTWTQPTLRLEGGAAITNLDVYPNPSRDVFNVAFTSEDVQDLEVRVINVVGEVVYTEDLQQFVGEYTKSIDLATYTKGVYFLEITTNTGVVNKKLILQ